MSRTRAVTVFLSSSRDVPQVYFDAAGRLGRLLGAAGYELVYGGNDVGSMKHLADGCRAAGGRVVGVTPRFFKTLELTDAAADELVYVETMRQRKQVMEDRGDAFITLPGGLGTLEELFEIIVGRQLQQHNKPIILVNVEGFFTPLIKLIEHGVEHRFVRPNALSLFDLTDSVEEAVTLLQQQLPAETGV
ncbi:MAG: TIGR00730 family Rossman fold protein [Phycisphaerae bacterium]